MRVLVLVLTAALVCLAHVPAQPADRARLADLVRGAVAFHDEHAEHPIGDPGGARIDRLLGGETVVVRRPGRCERTGRRLDSIHAYALRTEPRLHLWLAATRPGFGDSDVLTTVGIERHGDGRTRTFMHADLPWPLDDRHWIAHVRMDVPMAEVSGGRIWARRWTLDDSTDVRELARRGALGHFGPDDLDASRALPVNEGAFLVFDLDGRHTLLVYSSRVAAGGAIPDGFVVEFGARMLRRSIERVIEGARRVESEYRRGTPPRPDGFGRPVPHCDELEAQGPVTRTAPSGR